MMAVKAHLEGKPIREVADVIGVHYSQIARWGHAFEKVAKEDGLPLLEFIDQAHKTQL